MTKQEKNKLDEVITFIENFEEQSRQNYINATSKKARLYNLAIYQNIWYFIDKIKREFNIKD
ncbi:MAG: hypothetical protein SO148_00180 [Candidatus Onthovivens sp.]|nr:hypothetical protein [Candidatus Onthovivens sp.]